MRKLFTLVPLILLAMSSICIAQDTTREPQTSLMTYTFRVARPTDNLKEVLKFYRDGLGLEVLLSFNHLGYEGEILGRKGSPYHLEFLHQPGRKFGKAPTQNNLLVFYMPEAEWKSAVERMQKHGYQPVKSYNPYWDERGKTFQDIDGYRVVLEPRSSPHFRVTRSTDNFEEVIKFYRDGLGLDVLMGGKHEKYEGAALGRKGSQFELEFEHVQGETVGKAPTHENLHVFFIPDKTEWQSAVERMKKHGYQPVTAENPWGNIDGKTFEDIDGYRVVLKNMSWGLSPDDDKEEVLFDKKLTSPMSAGWYWVREVPKSWKVENGKLMLRSLPGYVYIGYNNAPNVLLRKAPVTSKALILEVYLENEPTLLWEHAGLYLYYDDDNYVCLLKEQVPKEVTVRLISEKDSKATFADEFKHEAEGVWLRLVIKEGKATEYYRQTDKEEWRRLGELDLPSKGEPKVGLNAGGGPKDAERWVTFSHFRILEQTK